MKILIIALFLSLSCDAADDVALRSDRLAAALTMDLAKKFAFGEFKGEGESDITRNEGVVTIFLEGFYVTLSKGGTLITAEEVERTKKANLEMKKQIAKAEADPEMKALLNALLASDDSDCPKIGLRARATDFMGQTLTFTTSDGKIDVHIEDAEPYSVKILDFAKTVCAIYDKQTAEQIRLALGDSPDANLGWTNRGPGL
jgi:hypothetical protein